ncbi:hypothetical protein FE810_05730 [Thalassotalea litorea]|uniref:Tetratricopeptide repeat protein n=1 Tax=Thalassotalea litorea TaxID=2020715 RepID=A0A5R9IL10_9GAMM|nr:hypothetical protein [Thalassotalea litorea]TLU66215.1 hypothetical protein FE810_05730 [Thalassotalea litorea]
MKIVVLLSLIFFITSCSVVTENPSVADGINYSSVKNVQPLTFEELDEEVNRLNPVIGMYPPRFSNEKHREQVFVNWIELVDEAQRFHQQQQEEKTFYMLTELYRMGHNMQVSGSGENALQYLTDCLEMYPSSVACNFSATYFYLTAGRYYLRDAEKSLDTLRAHYLPALNHEVESGFVFLYLFQQDSQKAKQQIEYFIDAFPESHQADEFAQIKKALAESP